MNTFINANNTWALWTIITGGAAISIFLEQRYKWAATLSGVAIALILSMLFSNTGIIPTEAPAYDIVWGYVVSLAIPLLLMKCDIKKIGKESRSLFLLFIIGSIGTMLGTLLAYTVLKNYIPELEGIAAMMTGTYIGGTVNFAALAKSFKVSGTMISAATVADNFLMTLYFFVLISIPSLSFFQKYFKHSYMDKMDLGKEKNTASTYWNAKEIGLKDIACAIATAFFIVTISRALSTMFDAIIPKTNFFFTILNSLLGNQYFIITSISVICASVFSQIFGEIAGTQEIGTFFIYLFFFVIGAPASLLEIMKNSPLLLVFCTIIVCTNMIVTFLFGKLFHFNLEEIILASNANIGGPTTAVAMAISKGWIELVAPIMLVGTMGYVIGTYFGTLMGIFLS